MGYGPGPHFPDTKEIERRAEKIRCENNWSRGRNEGDEKRKGWLQLGANVEEEEEANKLSLG